MNHEDFAKKIGVTSLKIYSKKDRWVFEHNGSFFDLAPAGVMDFVLSPLIVGVDRLVVAGCKKKGINNPESGFYLLFSKDYFPNADVLLKYRETKADGWIYDIEGLNLDVMQGQAAWICPYMKFYYSEPPKSLYLKLETLEV